VTALLRLAYKPIGTVAGLVGGMLAGAIFRWLWTRIGRDGEAPKATDADRGWAEVVLSAAAQGAVFGAVKSAVDRAGATGFAHATGVWPGRRRSKTR
jgi:hypothetical protein